MSMSAVKQQNGKIINKFLLTNALLSPTLEEVLPIEDPVEEEGLRINIDDVSIELNGFYTKLLLLELTAKELKQICTKNSLQKWEQGKACRKGLQAVLKSIERVDDEALQSDQRRHNKKRQIYCTKFIAGSSTLKMFSIDTL